MTDPLTLLAHPTRLEALRLLTQKEELCVCVLMETLEVSQSRMSRHMSMLKKGGFVVDRKQARWVHYTLNPDLTPPLKALLDAALNLPQQERWTP